MTLQRIELFGKKYLPRVMSDCIIGNIICPPRGNSILSNLFYLSKVALSSHMQSILSNLFYPQELILSSLPYFILSEVFYPHQVNLCSRCNSILPNLIYPPWAILSSPGHSILKFPTYLLYANLSPAALCLFKLHIILLIFRISLYPLNQTLSSLTFSGYFTLYNDLVPTLSSCYHFILCTIFHSWTLGFILTSQKYAPDASPNLV